MSETANNPRPATTFSDASDRLESWKEIAAYLKRDVRTIQRWEKREGFPVHRHLHDKLGTVYAYKTEIDAWWGSRGAQADQKAEGEADAEAVAENGTGWRTWLAGAAALMLLTAAGWQARGWLLQPATASGQPVVEQLAVIEGNPGRVSPDGKWLVYRESATWDLLLKNLANGESSRLAVTYARGPVVWSRDSRRVAFLSNSEVDARVVQLEVVDRNGANRRIVWQGVEDELLEPQDWSADGERLLCRARLPDGRQEIALLSLNDKRRTRVLLADGAISSAQFSPDDQLVSYAAIRGNQQNIFLTAVGTAAREVQLTHDPTWDSLPFWSADGRFVTFWRQRDSSASLRAVEIDPATGQPLRERFLMTPPGTRNRPLSRGHGDEVFLARRNRPAQIHLLDVDAATGAPRSHPHPAFEDFTFEPQWTAADNAIYYRKQMPDGRQVFAIRNMASSTDQSIYLPRNYTAAFFAPTPDGATLTFFGTGPGGAAGFFNLDLRTQKIAPLFATRQATVGPASWSPDGKELLYASGRADGGRFRIVSLRADMREERTLGYSASRPFPHYSPDGKYIAFSDKNCLQVMPRGGGESRRIVCAPPAVLPRFAFSEIGSLAWSPDGSKLSWTVHNEQQHRIELWIVDRATGKHSVWEGAANYGYWPGESTWSRDGSRIAFRMDYKPKYEIWRLRNLLSGIQSAD